MNRLNISLSSEQLIALFKANVLHPSQIQCLDSATRDAIKQMCLELCQPHNCQACAHHAHCATTLYQTPAMISSAMAATAVVSTQRLERQTLN